MRPVGILLASPFLHGLAAAESDAKTSFFLNHVPSFVFSAAAFLIFLWIVARFGVKPIMKAIEARDERIGTQLDEAEQAFARAKNLQKELDEKLAGAEARINELMAEARKDGESAKAALVEEGRGEIDVQRQRALREIEAALHAAVVELRDEVADLSTIVAGKILDERLDASRHQDLVATTIEDYRRKVGKGGA